MNPYRQPLRYPAQPPAVYTPPEGSEKWDTPWVQLKYFSNHPQFFPAMIGTVAARLARIIDRARELEDRLDSGAVVDTHAIYWELNRLSLRGSSRSRRRIWARSAAVWKCQRPPRSTTAMPRPS